MNMENKTYTLNALLGNCNAYMEEFGEDVFKASEALAIVINIDKIKAADMIIKFRTNKKIK